MSRAAALLKSELLQLIRRPLVATLVVVPLVLGGTATTTVRGVAATILGSDLGIRSASDLVAVSVLSSTSGLGFLSPPEVVALRDAVPDLVSASPYSGGGLMQVTLNGRVETVPFEAVGDRYLEALGTSPTIGRFFSAQEFRSGAAVTLISHVTWVRTFGGRTDVVGKQLDLHGKPFTVIGVMPATGAALRVEHEPAVVVPLSVMPALTGVPAAGRASYLIGRYAGTRQSLDARIQAAWKQVQATGARPEGGARDRIIRVEPAGNGFSTLRTRYGQSLRLLQGLMFLVMALCYLTAGVVILTRWIIHDEHTAVKRALGATPRDLGASAAVQGVLLSCFAAAVSVPLSHVAARWVKEAMWTGLLPMSRVAPPGAAVYGELALFALGGGLIASVPAILFVLYSSERAASRDRSAMRGIGWRVRCLVVLQIAVTVCVSYAAVMLTWELYRLSSVSPGYQPAGLYWTRLAEVPGLLKSDVPETYYPDLLSRLEGPSAPGAALSFQFPAAARDRATFTVVFAERPDGPTARAMVDAVSPGFFALLERQILRGRDFSWQDSTTSNPVAIVNTRLARDLYGTDDVIGKTLLLGEGEEAERFEIVGVAPGISPGDPRMQDVPVAYRAINQMPSALHIPILLVRDTRGVLGLRDHVDSQVRALGRHYVWFQKAIAETLREHTMSERVSFVLGAIVCAVAWLLTGLTLYGLLSFLVRAERRALGVRVALGATAAHVIWHVYKEAVYLATAGSVLGATVVAAGSYYFREALGSMPLAWGPLAMAVLLVGTVSVLAGWRPAARASSTDVSELLGAA